MAGFLAADFGLRLAQHIVVLHNTTVVHYAERILMPRASKSQSQTPSQPEPTGPRLVRTRTPRRPAAVATPATVTHEQIATRAYELFVEEGFTHGHHLDHWLRAERELIDIAALPTAQMGGTRTRG
jgi:hypothetical protein